MGWSNQVVQASEVIIAGYPDALFVYFGTPGPNKLIASIAAVGGTDPYGNAYQPGITSYNGTPNFISIANSIISLSNGVLIEENGPFLSIGGTGGQAINIDLPFGEAVTAVQPGTSVTPEAWHAMTMLNGWIDTAGFAPAQYRWVASPPNSVEIIGTISATAATAITFATLPAGYRPASVQGFAIGTTNGQTGQVCQVRCDASGNLTVNSAPAVPVNQAYFFHGFISLDA
ncbi:MAG TPA: hypothetical protein VGH54_28195 [Mycobacterium sp.]|jgi:hypothetical protein|uniref:hypothetical protein n=1 Tax=Mycobacterium sp. TaxID=1785 RepID=UPI002F41E3FD